MDATILTFDAAALARDAGTALTDAAAIDAATIFTDAGMRRDASTTDAGTPDEPTNTPWAPLVWTAAGPSGGLTLIASNFVQEMPSGSFNWEQRWHIVLENRGPDPICSILVYGELRDAAGRSLASPDVVLRSPHWITFGRDSSCLGPGQRGAGVSFATAPTEITLTDVARVEYSASGNIDPAAYLNPGAPSIDSATIVMGLSADYWRVRGTVTGHGGVRFVTMSVFPTNTAGMPLDELVTSTSALSTGARWDYETTTLRGRFDTFLQFLNYSMP